MIFYDSISSGASLSAKSGKESITKVVLFFVYSTDGRKGTAGTEFFCPFFVERRFMKIYFRQPPHNKTGKACRCYIKRAILTEGWGLRGREYKIQKVPRFGCAVRIPPFGKGHRGKRKGKGSRCGAAASIARSIPNTIHGERSSQSHNYTQRV